MRELGTYDVWVRSRISYEANSDLKSDCIWMAKSIFRIKVLQSWKGHEGLL